MVSGLMVLPGFPGVFIDAGGYPVNPGVTVTRKHLSNHCRDTFLSSHMTGFTHFFFVPD
jgi:hypothetical protein